MAGRTKRTDPDAQTVGQLCGVIGVGRVRVDDARAGDEDARVREPEAAEQGERRRAERLRIKMMIIGDARGEKVSNANGASCEDGVGVGDVRSRRRSRRCRLGSVRALPRQWPGPRRRSG